MIWTRHLSWPRRTGIALAACLTATGVFAADAAMPSCVTATPEQRIERCSEMLSRGPGDPPSDQAIAYVNRGRVSLLQGELDRAFEDLNEAIRLDPENAHAFAFRADVYQRHGAYEHAWADLDQAIRLDPDLALAYALRGQIYADQGKLDDALADLNEAVHLDPTSADAYAFRAVVHEATGRASRAMADAEAALAREPDHRQAAEVKERVRTELASRTRSKLATAKVRKSHAINERSWPTGGSKGPAYRGTDVLSSSFSISSLPSLKRVPNRY
jgi:tetratricopeptide (TPR) repeat protein